MDGQALRAIWVWTPWDGGFYWIVGQNFPLFFCCGRIRTTPNNATKTVLLKPQRLGKSRTILSNPGRLRAERDKSVQVVYLESTLNYFLGNVSCDRLTKLELECPIFKTLLYSWVNGGWAVYSWNLNLSAGNLQLLSPPCLTGYLRYFTRCGECLLQVRIVWAALAQKLEGYMWLFACL